LEAISGNQRPAVAISVLDGQRLLEHAAAYAGLGKRPQRSDRRAHDLAAHLMKEAFRRNQLTISCERRAHNLGTISQSRHDLAAHQP
jgi:hypothetical protein